MFILFPLVDLKETAAERGKRTTGNDISLTEGYSLIEADGAPHIMNW